MVIVGLGTAEKMVGTAASVVKTLPSVAGTAVSFVKTLPSVVRTPPLVVKTPPSVATRAEAVRYFFANYLALTADNPSFIVNFAETYISNMRKICIFLYALLLCLSSYGQARRNTLYQQYINQYKDLAIQQMLRYSKQYNTLI